MQLSFTPAAPALTPAMQPITAPAQLSVPSTGKAPQLASLKPGSLAATDVPVSAAVASATRRLDAVGSASDAVAAASLIKGATKDILTAHRGALDIGISPALDKQLVGVATDLTKLAVNAARTPTLDLDAAFPKAHKQAADVLAVLSDHVARIERQSTDGTYL